MSNVLDYSHSVEATRLPLSYLTAQRINRSKEIAFIKRKGKCFLGKYLKIYYNANSGDPRIAIRVTKRYGKANRRNRFKRLIREAFRLNAHKFKTSYDLLVYPQLTLRPQKLEDILEDLQFFW
ncbi:MAG: hypothetical protein Tsb0021_13270 [Chlamydiales bacterium]